jgi:hypothetical protein
MSDDEWRLPSELSQPVPRAFRRNRSCRTMVLLGIALCIVPSALLDGIAFPMALRIQHLLESGQLATGQIYDRQTTFSRGHKGYVVGYRFTEPGTRIEGDGISGVDEVQFSTLLVGTPVKVVYETNRPDISALAIALQTSWAHPWAGFAKMMAIGIGLSGSIAALFFGYIGLRYFRERHLIRWGTVVAARIIGEEEVRIRYGRITRLTYQYCSNDGELHEGNVVGFRLANLVRSTQQP